jgi:hypothetical protein
MMERCVASPGSTLHERQHDRGGRRIRRPALASYLGVGLPNLCPVAGADALAVTVATAIVIAGSLVAGGLFDLLRTAVLELWCGLSLNL